MKEKRERSKRFLTKDEYAEYLEAMKQHAAHTPSEGVSSRLMTEE